MQTSILKNTILNVQTTKRFPVKSELLQYINLPDKLRVVVLKLREQNALEEMILAPLSEKQENCKLVQFIMLLH